MKQSLPFLLCLFLLTFFSTNTNAQNYGTALGARLGYPFSASIKHFFSESVAGEAYVGTRGYSSYRWTNASAAFQKHSPIDGVDGLSWYWGAGASVYFWSFDDAIFFDDDYNNTSFGVQGYVGLDYSFSDIPLNLTLDWIPTLFLNSYTSGFGGGYGSLGVRYILSR